MLKHSLDVVLELGDHLFGLAFCIALTEGWEPFDVLLGDFLVDFVLQTCEVSWTLESQTVEIVKIVPEVVSVSSVLDEGRPRSFHLNSQINTAGLSIPQI